LHFVQGVPAKGLQFSRMAQIRRYSTRCSVCLLPMDIIVWLFGVRVRDCGNTFLLDGRYNLPSPSQGDLLIWGGGLLPL
jgi:hypothetical protein